MEEFSASIDEFFIEIRVFDSNKHVHKKAYSQLEQALFRGHAGA